MAAAAFFIKKNSTRSLRKAMSGEKEAQQTKRRVVATLHNDGLYAIVVDAENANEAEEKADAFAKSKRILTTSKPNVASEETESTVFAKKGAASGTKKTKSEASTSGASDGGNNDWTSKANASTDSAHTGVPSTAVDGKKKKKDDNDDATDDGDESDTSEQQHAEGVHLEKEEPDAPPEYTVAEFLSKYKPTKSGDRPLQGSASAGQIKQNKAVFEENLKNLGNEIATWVVLPKSTVTSGSDLDYSDGTIGDKGIQPRARAVVVVRSTLFFVPDDNENKSRKKMKESILVCNVPVANFTNKFFKKQQGSGIDRNKVKNFVDGTFKLIAAFVENYNSEKQDAKIQFIAMPYFGGKVQSTNDWSLEELTYERITGFGGKHVKKKVTVVGAGAIKTGAKPKKESSEDEEGFDKVYSNIWFDARIEFIDLVKKHDVKEVMLMLGDGPWGAHKDISENSTRIRPFPECISVSEANEEEEAGYIPQNMIKHTLFVCDREVGSKVGNKNNSDTTGGIFGMYVPMHYVAAPFPDDFAENKWLTKIYV
jgi:hypothetical protein